MTEKPKAENCFDVYEEYTKTGEEIRVYRADATDRYIDALRMEAVENVVSDLTRWRKCDPVTGAPGTDYYRLRPKLTLVNVKFNYLGENIKVINIARWDLNAECWKFQCDEDPMNERENCDQFKVVGWRPIY